MKKFRIYVHSEGTPAFDTIQLTAEKAIPNAENGVAFYVKSEMVAYFSPPNFIGYATEDVSQ